MSAARQSFATHTLQLGDAPLIISRIAESNSFGFEAVFAFVFKWDILQAWLARDAEKAKSRFQELIKEVKNDS